jgi:hypothetical protein
MAAGVAVALVFFPFALAVPVAVLLGTWGVGMAAFGASVTLDTEAGLLTLRMGPILRRVRLTDVTAVLVDRSKVSIGRAGGGEISLYAWGKGRLDALLGVPAVAGDIGHAVAAAVALAKAHADPVTDLDAAGAGPRGAGPAGARPPAGPGAQPAATRSRLATVLLGGSGVVAIGCALVVRVDWQNPALTVTGVIVALALGVSGLLYLLVALWILLTGRAPRFTLGS